MKFEYFNGAQHHLLVKLMEKGTTEIHIDTTYLLIGLIHVLLDFSLTVKAATLIFISGYGSVISSIKERKSCFIYNLVKSY